MMLHSLSPFCTRKGSSRFRVLPANAKREERESRLAKQFMPITIRWTAWPGSG